MKPLGPIPAGYETIDGELAIGGCKASALADDAGTTPLFVYSAEMIRAKFPKVLAISGAHQYEAVVGAVHEEEAAAVERALDDRQRRVPRRATNRSSPRPPHRRRRGRSK